MSLLFTVEGTQYIRHFIAPGDSSIDNLAQWSVAAWIYPTGYSATERGEVFNKAHAKRFGIEGTGGSMLLKQNKTTSVIQYGATFLTTNQWEYVCGVVDANAVSPNQQAWIYHGTLTSAAAEVGTYFEEITGYTGTLEDDTVDAQGNTPGDLIVGNKPWRNPWNGNRGFGGRIAWIAFWSTNVDLGTLKAFQFAYTPPDLTNLELCARYFQPGKQADLSGNGRNGHTFLL